MGPHSSPHESPKRRSCTRSEPPESSERRYGTPSYLPESAGVSSGSLADPHSGNGRNGRTRREVLSGVAVLGASTVAACGRLPGRGGARSGPADGSTTVALEPVAEGLTAPLAFESPDGVDAHYVVDQAGSIRVLGPDGLRPDPFLDVRDRMVDVEGYDERGLLGVAFHPEFPADDRVFVRYSAPPREGTPQGWDHTFVLASFSASADGADPDSERTLLEIPQPQMNHDGGPVAFGPDGLLYVAVGDGGGAGDQGVGHAEDWYGAVPGGNGQDVAENLLGSVLRIDVDTDGEDRPYGIPEDNPLVGREGLDEHYAWGFRNPWGMSFAPDGRLLVADVGQNEYEEVNVVERGGNYGWNVREGRHCYATEECYDETPEGRPLRDPVVEYDHGGDPPNGAAVVGGHVYQGSIGALRGRYVFGDWRSGPGGALFAATQEGDDWPVEVLSVETPSENGMDRLLLGLGTDRDGELYACTSGRTTVGGSTGVVYRVVPSTGSTTTTTDTGRATTTTEAGGTTATGTTGGESPTETGQEPTTGGDGTRTTTGAGSGAGTATDDGDDGVGLPGFGATAALAGLGGLAATRYLIGSGSDETPDSRADDGE